FIEYQGWKRPQEVSSPTPVTDSLSSLSTNNKATTADTASMDSTKANNFLMEIMGALQTLLAQNAVLQAQAMPSSGPNPTPCESKLPLPDKFNGDCRNFATWDGLPTVFTREALVWASPLLEKASPLLGQFEDFVLAMVVIVNDPITSLQLKLYFRCCIRKADQLLNVQRRQETGRQMPYPTETNFLNLAKSSLPPCSRHPTLSDDQQHSDILHLFPAPESCIYDPDLPDSE
uniref:Uncharacterized protein n=1 Tax=Chrysemys picta bellii TaxID=8478 RepID=A0A8C3F4X9_CHRPI